MKQIICLKRISFLLIFLWFSNQPKAQQLPVYNPAKYKSISEDWLVKPVLAKAEILKSADGKNIVLYNGLLKRAFRITPNLACVDFRNLTTGRQFLRAVKAEARLTINGREYNVGGLHGQKENAYLLPLELDHMKAGKSDFQFVDYTVSPLRPYLDWKTRFWMPPLNPITGKTISFRFRATAPGLNGLEVKIKYDLFDGMPLIVKSLSIENKGSQTFKINRIINEELGMVEEESSVEGTMEKMRKPNGIYFETNYAFNNSMNYANSEQTMHWKPDSTYTSQVHYRLQTPCLLEIYPEIGPGIELHPAETFYSVRTNELLVNGDSREQRGLAIRKMYRAIAPWTTANPIFMHLVCETDEQVHTAIDQCEATGYEALIISFGSQLNMEDTSEANLMRWKGIADYAHRKGIKIGCYSLFSSRNISPQDDVIDSKTGKPGGALFGGLAPCFGSKWGLDYRAKIKNFISRTGFDIFENDGPYPGDLCASTTHPGHMGLDDSQWRQLEIQKELYHWLNGRGVYINSPDWYFLDGSNKIALGYREVNFTLPREDQMILNRQNIFDGTWEKIPSMSWGLVPLTAYGAGGPDAVLEPLHEHLKDYEQLMMQYYGSGIQACYRGPRLYDTHETKDLVIKVIKWYKKYRDILNSDIIHLRRADGRDWDGILHVNHSLKTKGLMMLYNPVKEKITRTITVPLYYTGLTNTVKVREKEGPVKTYKLDRDYTIDLTFSIEPESYTWYEIE